MQILMEFSFEMDENGEKKKKTNNNKQKNYYHPHNKKQGKAELTDSSMPRSNMTYFCRKMLISY